MNILVKQLKEILFQYNVKSIKLNYNTVSSALSMFKCRVGFECILSLNEAKNAVIVRSYDEYF
ncbi:MAG: hypothetical protein ACI8P3_002903 [Saprospiraceae bacterium]|jgi:hypothetical protein